MSVEERLERLERKVRWMRRGAVCAALVAAVFLMGKEQEKELPDLEVRSLTVKDEAGTVRAKLSATRHMPSLNLLDENGNRIALETGADGSPLLTLHNASGKVIWQAPKE